MELNIIDLPLTAYRGDTFSRQLFVISDYDLNGVEIPLDLSDYEFNMQLRLNLKSTEPVIHFSDSNFYSGSSTTAEQYDIDNGDPTGTTNDELYILVPAADMKFNANVYLYDLEMKQPDGTIITPIRGNFTLQPDITRDIEYT